MTVLIAARWLDDDGHPYINDETAPAYEYDDYPGEKSGPGRVADLYRTYEGKKYWFGKIWTDDSDGCDVIGSLQDTTDDTLLVYASLLLRTYKHQGLSATEAFDKIATEFKSDIHNVSSLSTVTDTPPTAVLAAGPRKVRTSEGAKRYGQPIDSVITNDRNELPAVVPVATIKSYKLALDSELQRRKIIRETGQDLSEADDNAVRLDFPDADLEALYRTASEKYKSAAAAEPAISADVVDAVTKFGGVMSRFESRLKTEDSMRRKLADLVVDDNVTLERAAELIKDTVRYTAVFPDDQYWGRADRVSNSLQKDGYPENYTSDGWYPDSGYVGRNDSFISPSGVIFEVQSHTASSLVAANKNHKIYDKYRKSSTTRDEKRRLRDIMREVASAVPVPEGTPIRNLNSNDDK